MKNPIVAALEALRSAAVDAAIGRACEIVERQRKGESVELTDSTPTDERQVQMFSGIELSRPTLPLMNNAEASQFIASAKEDAENAYTAFIEKAASKVGPVKSAILTGNHVTGSSILTVKKADGTEEQWETRQQVNVSKLGKVFIQWPMRKLKQKTDN